MKKQYYFLDKQQVYKIEHNTITQHDCGFNEFILSKFKIETDIIITTADVYNQNISNIPIKNVKLLETFLIQQKYEQNVNNIFLFVNNYIMYFNRIEKQIYYYSHIGALQFKSRKGILVEKQDIQQLLNSCDNNILFYIDLKESNDIPDNEIINYHRQCIIQFHRNYKTIFAKINNQTLLMIYNNVINLKNKQQDQVHKVKIQYLSLQSNKKLKLKKCTYLTILNQNYYFYQNNKCYQCNQYFEILNKWQIDFPYNNHLFQHEDFRFFPNDYPHLFYTILHNEKYYTNVYDIIYKFDKNNVYPIKLIPNYPRNQKNNAKIVSWMGKLLVTNGSQIYELVDEKDYILLAEVKQTSAIRLHLLNNQLIIRDPYNKKLLTFDYKWRLITIFKEFYSTDLVISTKKFLLNYYDKFQLTTYEDSLVYQQSFGDGFDVNIDNRFETYKLGQYGWDITNEIFFKVTGLQYGQFLSGIKSNKFDKYIELAKTFLLSNSVNTNLKLYHYNHIIIAEHYQFYQVLMDKKIKIRDKFIKQYEMEIVDLLSLFHRIDLLNYYITQKVLKKATINQFLNIYQELDLISILKLINKYEKNQEDLIIAVEALEEHADLNSTEIQKIIIKNKTHFLVLIYYFCMNRNIEQTQYLISCSQTQQVHLLKIAIQFNNQDYINKLMTDISTIQYQGTNYDIYSFALNHGCTLEVLQLLYDYCQSQKIKVQASLQDVVLLQRNDQVAYFAKCSNLELNNALLSSVNQRSQQLIRQINTLCVHNQYIDTDQQVQQLSDIVVDNKGGITKVNHDTTPLIKCKDNYQLAANLTYLNGYLTHHSKCALRNAITYNYPQFVLKTIFEKEQQFLKYMNIQFYIDNGYMSLLQSCDNYAINVHSQLYFEQGNLPNSCNDLLDKYHRNTQMLQLQFQGFHYYTNNQIPKQQDVFGRDINYIQECRQQCDLKFNNLVPVVDELQSEHCTNAFLQSTQFNEQYDYKQYINQ